ncbi:ribonuclease domain-containing protein [Nocardia stercoris]|uniref:Ribonuclease n=1 Tax=Nocardia stercoris TaxID=2483361 RepID=A0A3M2L221_9NOCA|nr:ribonuclease domain-containing protein [Nocardia stercoris]RMI31769.1 ribonuclease [Nocardia stercoris]
MNLSDKRIRAIFGVIGLLVVIGFAVTGLLREQHSSSSAPRAASSVSATKPAFTSAPPVTAHAPGVPDRAYVTLAEIDAGRWPGSANAPGTHGGDPWMNRSGQLPRTDPSGKTLSYQEWDVNPKRPGQTRDAQRIITDNIGDAYYTGDHYQTFTRMR